MDDVEASEADFIQAAGTHLSIRDCSRSAGPDERLAIFAAQNCGLHSRSVAHNIHGLTCPRLDGLFLPPRSIAARQSRPLRMRLVGPPWPVKARGGTASVRGPVGLLNASLVRR